MEIPTLVSVLDHPHLAVDHLHAWKLSDPHRGRQTLLEPIEWLDDRWFRTPGYDPGRPIPMPLVIRLSGRSN